MQEVMGLTLAGAIGAYVAKDGVNKLLGPTCEYLGIGLKSVVEKNIQNLGKIFGNAVDKLGSKLDQPGSIPPKVLKHILDEGSFANDELAVEYFGGVLASARTDIGRDDRAASLLKIIGGLSVYQLRAHFVVYSVAKLLYEGSRLSFSLAGREHMNIYIPDSEFIKAMGFDEGELAKQGALYRHIFAGLARLGLIDGFMGFGGVDYIRQYYIEDATEGGIICRPTESGAELYLSVFGLADKLVEYLYEPEFVNDLAESPSIPQSARNIGYYSV